MDQAIRMCVKSQIGLRIFKDYPALRKWILENKPSLAEVKAFINYTTNTITFPNGNRLLLGCVENDKDLDKYLSYEFMFVLGTTKLNHRIRL